jgi:SnoaL-like domain
MARRQSIPEIALLAMLALPASLAGQGTLTPQDRGEIQELSAKYARTLGTCAAEEYADLFAPDMGYFASNPRRSGRTRPFDRSCP